MGAHNFIATVRVFTQRKNKLVQSKDNLVLPPTNFRLYCLFLPMSRQGPTIISLLLYHLQDPTPALQWCLTPILPTWQEMIFLAL